MPAHKNQHFVPKIYLKPFSVVGGGRAINLLNIRSGRPIPNAPLRNQCARDYLYSPAGDMRIEKLLQELEGEYAKVLKALDDPRESATNEMMVNLRLFTFIQHLRTDQAMRARKTIEEDVYRISFEGAMSERAPDPLHRRKSDRDFMFDTMQAGMMNSNYIHDLKHCVIDNSSGVDFVTSDDPAVMTNRYLKQKFGHTNFGFGSSGTMFVLPLSPRRLFLMYDGGVYTIPDKSGNGRIRIKREASVHAFNELQYIRAAENIYFADWQARGEVSRRFDEVKSHRRDSWTTVRVLLPGGRSVNGQHFRLPVSEEERLGASEKVVHLASEFPAATTWATEIKLRNSPRTFSNGTAVGLVRKREWLTSGARNSAHRGRQERMVLVRPDWRKK